jgi:hypothetical protein
MIDLDTQCFAGNVRVEPLDLEQAFFQVLLEFTLQDLFTILGDPNNRVLMVVCTVGTKLDLHAHMVSKPSSENLQPSAVGFHPPG